MIGLLGPNGAGKTTLMQMIATITRPTSGRISFQGVDVVAVDVQVMIAPGTLGFPIVGLADKAVGESRERVRAALRALGLALPPQRISVNLSPADLAKALMSINAVKGVEIGDGFATAAMSGEDNADEMRMKDGALIFLSNHAGGILGGISSGQDLVCRPGVKPTSMRIGLVG